MKTKLRILIGGVLLALVFLVPTVGAQDVRRSLTKVSVLLFGDGTVGGPSMSFTSQLKGFYSPIANTIGVSLNGVETMEFDNTGAAPQFLLPAARLAFSAAAGTRGDSADVFLVRDAANTLALKNGTNPQTFRVYSTTTGPVISSLTGTFLAIGANPSTAGELRLPNNGAGVASRNAANNANITLLFADNSNVIQVGDPATPTVMRSNFTTLGFNSTNVVFATTAPTITSGFGTSPTITGTDTAFRLTLGNPVAQSGVVAFNATYTNAPVVSCVDETTIGGQPLKTAPTTTNVTITLTAAVASDKVGCIVVGF